MKVKVHVTVRKVVSFDLEEDYNMTENEIRDKAWDYAYDCVCGNEDVSDVNWEVIEGDYKDE